MTHYMCHLTPTDITVARDVPSDYVAQAPWVVLSAEELKREQERRESIPASITARQIRLWLVRHGISLAAVESAIDSIQDATVRDSVRVEWEYAPYVERAHPWLVPMAAALGLNADQIDQAFREAAAL